MLERDAKDFRKVADSINDEKYGLDGSRELAIILKLVDDASKQGNYDIVYRFESPNKIKQIILDVLTDNGFEIKDLLLLASDLQVISWEK